MKTTYIHMKLFNFGLFLFFLLDYIRDIRLFKEISNRKYKQFSQFAKIGYSRCYDLIPGRFPMQRTP